MFLIAGSTSEAVMFVAVLIETLTMPLISHPLRGPARRLTTVFVAHTKKERRDLSTPPPLFG